MKFQMRVKTVGSQLDFWEDYNKPGTGDAQAIARGIIDNYNTTLRPGEHARELLEVVVVDSSANSDMHDWEKTNGFTIAHRGVNFDTYRCRKCRITGKRFGLSATVARDAKFKSKKYEKCQ